MIRYVTVNIHSHLAWNHQTLGSSYFSDSHAGRCLRGVERYSKWALPSRDEHVTVRTSTPVTRGLLGAKPAIVTNPFLGAAVQSVSLQRQ